VTPVTSDEITESVSGLDGGGRARIAGHVCGGGGGVDVVMGVLATTESMLASALRRPSRGQVRTVTQSGAFGAADEAQPLEEVRR
jgi:hypothetical protein